MISTDCVQYDQQQPLCQRIALTGQGTAPTATRRIRFTQSALPQVDLLWVIDDSELVPGSPGRALDAGARNSSPTPRRTPDGTWKADFHIGVIGNEVDMTDTTADNYSAVTRVRQIYVGGLFGNNAGAGGPYIVESSTLNAGAGVCQQHQDRHLAARTRAWRV